MYSEISIDACTLCRMPEELSTSDQALSAKVTVTRSKTAALKKGLTCSKNQQAARKKEMVAQSLQAPKELVDFLQAPATWERVLVVAEENVTDMFVRRYATAFDVMWGKIAVTTMACLGS